MAEAAVSVVIQKLGDLLNQKIGFLNAVGGQVQQLRDELVAMRCFLKDAAEKQDEEEGIRNWVSQIRAAAYDSEDVIEIYIQEIQSEKPAKNCFEMMVNMLGEVCTRNKVGKEIESIQRRIRDIADRRERLGIKNLGEGSTRRAKELQQLRRSSPSTEDKDVVGLQEKSSYLVSKLLNDEKHRSVVSIIGMGGIGKTTLAREIYQHPNVKARFSCRAWVCVSQNYNPKYILGGIIKQVNKRSRGLPDKLEKLKEPELEQMLPQELKDESELEQMLPQELKDESELEQMLYQELKDECYLIVVDDIWKKDHWDCLLRAFPDGDKSSRVLLTSRNQHITAHTGPRSLQYELKTLGEKDSSQLLLKMALGARIDLGSLEEFKRVGRDIASRCAGLPLAITVIGSLLAEKKTLDQWKRVLNSINANSINASEGQTKVLEILALSYNDLPSHLKSCFLYFGFFPEDFEVRTRKLFQLWIAEGLIQKKGRETLEDVAADFLDELVSRNMVQVAEWSSDEAVKSCRTHDLMRDLAIKKAEEEIFLEINGVGDAQFSSRARHLSVHCHSIRYTLTNSIPHVRSLLFFRSIYLRADVILDFTCLKLLRVLDLENFDIIYLPEEIGEVGLLRFLCLRGTRIEKLPSSLGRLRNLQTLDICTFTVVEVPDVIWKLENLRHLYMENIKCIVPLKIDTIRNLQTLSAIKFSYLMHNNFLMLTSLQKLGVWIGEGSEIHKLFNSIAELENLKYLGLFYTNESRHSVEGLSKRCHLTRLKLRGKLTMPPSPHHFPRNLSHLSLVSTKFDEDPMPILGKLEQLSVLKLKGADRGGRQIVIQENSFPRLKHFTLSGCTLVKDIALGKGAMPELRCLRISNCPSLEMLPEELKCMNSLQRLEITAKRNFIRRIEGVDSYKVCHVPVVILREEERMFRLKEKIRLGLLASEAAKKFLSDTELKFATYF